MILYLGNADLSEMELPMDGPNLTLWLREEDDFTATLEGDGGPIGHLAVREGWRVFAVTGNGCWRARFANKHGVPLVARLTVAENEKEWLVQISDPYSDW